MRRTLLTLGNVGRARLRPRRVGGEAPDGHYGIGRLPRGQSQRERFIGAPSLPKSDFILGLSGCLHA